MQDDPAFEIDRDGTLWVYQRRIRSRTQIETLRGILVNAVVVETDLAMPAWLRAYLDEVLQPIVFEARGRRAQAE